MRERIRSLVIGGFGLDESLEDDASLFASGLLDSLSAVELLTNLNEQIGMELSPLDIGLDDLDSISAIMKTVEKFG